MAGEHQAWHEGSQAPLPHVCLLPLTRRSDLRLRRCRSLQNAGVTADEVNYVNAHATSTPAGDMAEYRAIRAAIPGSHVRINGTKSMIGHLLGAAGAVEAVATVQAIRTGIRTLYHAHRAPESGTLNAVHSCGG